MEILFFLAQLSGHIRAGVLTVMALTVLIGVGAIVPVLRRFSGVIGRAASGSKLEKTLIALTVLVMGVEGFAAMAPLTGSDALHYHFTAPLLVLESGFHPNFFLSHSFFSGQSHLLIFAGLALGSSQFAMGLLFLGGVLAAGAGACLARRWTNRAWAWTVALAFLVTPVVFWQISTAGAPDLWMALFSTVGVLVISRARDLQSSSLAVVAGALAGGVAGTKYTGCLVAASMAVAYCWEARSVLRSFLFAGGFLGAGIWPYARNFVWTNDPMFPFLLRWLAPGKVNAYALASYLADTGAGNHRTVWEVIRFPFFARIDLAHLGLWQFLGPLVLAFAPLLILTVRDSPTWRTALTVWVLSALGIGATSGMTRFLLPVLPVALAATLAGVAQLTAVGWKAARTIAIATLCCFLLFGTVGLFAYDEPALLVAAGLVSPEQYLRQHAPEYEKTQIINRVLEGKGKDGKALVFLRHLYYIRAPFLYGDPAASWAIEPSRLQTPEEWQKLFDEEHVGWVVRSPAYPPEIAAPLNQLEAEGKLVPIERAEVTDFAGFRIAAERQSVPIVILRVRK